MGEEEPVDGENVPGHMLPLGAKTELLPVDVLTEFPDASEFFEKYVIPSRPVLFRGAAKQLPCYEHMRSEEFLRKNYGDVLVSSELGKKEDRDAEETKMTMAKFLDEYKTKNMYMVHAIDRASPLANEVYVPKPLICDDVVGRSVKTNMWFSSGGTKSVLHSDSYENVNCLFDGEKTFLLTHKNQRELLEFNDENFSSVDVDKVDMNKYSHFGSVAWYSAKMEPGDCFYLPSLWAHQVNSSPTRNLAMNFWFDKMLALPNPDKCKKQGENKKFAALKDFKSVSDDEFRRDALIDTFEPEREPITSDRLHSVLYSQFPDVTTLKQTKKIFAEIDKDGNGSISFQDLYNADISVFKEFLNEIKNNWGGIVPKPEEFDLEQEGDQKKDEEEPSEEAEEVKEDNDEKKFYKGGEL